MEKILMTKKLAPETSFLPLKAAETKTNWKFEVEPHFCLNGESVQELRDNMRLKKALKRAMERDAAPASLIEAIRREIRA